MDFGCIAFLTSSHYNLLFLCFSPRRKVKDATCKPIPRNLGTWFCPWLLWNASSECSSGQGCTHRGFLGHSCTAELSRQGSLGNGDGGYSKKTSSQEIWGDSPMVLEGKENWFSPSEGNLTISHKIICACIFWLTNCISRNLSPIVCKCLCAKVTTAGLLMIAKY